VQFDQAEHFRDSQGFVNLMALAGQLFRERMRSYRGEQYQCHAADVFFRSAQRFFIASPIRLRAAADRCRFLPLVALPAGRLR